MERPIEKDIIVELNPARVKSTPLWLLQQWEHRARICYVSFTIDGNDYVIPPDYIAVLHFHKPDTKEVIKYLRINGDTVLLEFDAQMTAASGLALAQIVFVTPDNDIKLRTPLMYFQVAKGIGQNHIKSTSQYSVLNQTLDKIRETFIAIPHVKKIMAQVEEAGENVREALERALKAECQASSTLEEAKRTTAKAAAAVEKASKAVKTAEKASATAQKATDRVEKFIKNADETYITAKIIRPKRRECDYGGY